MPRSPQDRTKVNLFLQSDVLAALKKMATIRGTTYSDLVREACRRYVVAEGSKLVREQQQLASMTPGTPVPAPPCGCSAHPTNRYDYCDEHRPPELGNLPDINDPRERQ